MCTSLLGRVKLFLSDLLNIGEIKMNSGDIKDAQILLEDVGLGLKLKVFYMA